MIKGISDQIAEWNNKKNVEAIVIDREAAKHPRPVFCMGRDIRTLHQYATPKQKGATEKSQRDSEQEAEDYFKQQYHLNLAVANSPLPVIVFNDGFTRGSGLTLTANAKYRIATENTVVDLPHNRVGLFTDIGSSLLLQRLYDLPLSLFLCLTGAKMNADDCMMNYLYTHFMKSAEIPLFLKALSASHYSIPQQFEFIQFDLNVRPDDRVPKLDMEKIRAFFKPDNNGIAGIMKRLESSSDPWCHTTLALMRKSSPASLELSYHLITRGPRIPTQESVAADLKAAKLVFGKEHSPLRPHFVRGAERLLKIKDQPGWPADSVAADLDGLHSVGRSPKV